jgi:3',5'-cyclic-AMP phosphodiesterase
MDAGSDGQGCPGSRQSRRSVLRSAAAVGAGLLVGCNKAGPAGGDRPYVARGAPGKVSPMASGSTRFVHLTDIHVKPGDNSAHGARHAFGKAEARRPDFIVTGGDHIACALKCDADWAHAQWREYRRILDGNARCPVFPLMGNHDVWGWAKRDIAESSAGYGKAMAMDYLGMRETYYAFDAGAWRIICLDNIARHPLTGGYYGDLDPAQTDWLQHELGNAAGKHVAVITHIPLLSACVFFDGEDRVRADHWHVPDAWMHRNSGPLLRLLRKGNAKLMISGHIHLLDRVEYNGMTFICDGAVSGGWWHGPYHETPPGMGVFDLCDDGTFKHEYVPLDPPATIA